MSQGEAVANSPAREWYIQAMGQELGPMDLPHLRGLYASGELLPDDLVRHGDSQWEPASTVSHLTNASQPLKTSPVPTEPGASKIDEPHRVQRPQQTTREAHAARRTPRKAVPHTRSIRRENQALLSSVCDQIVDAIDEEALRESVRVPVHRRLRNSVASAWEHFLGQFHSDAADQDETRLRVILRGCRTQLSRPLVRNSLLGVAACVLLVWWLLPSDVERAITAYDTVLKQIDDLREQGASQEQWALVVADAQSRIDAICEDLDQAAVATDPTSQELLWAGQKYSKRMLEEAPYGVSESEEFFRTHVANAHKLLNGEAIAEPRPQEEFNAFTVE